MSTECRRIPHSSHWGRFDAIVDGGGSVDIVPFSPDPDPTPLVHGVGEALESPVRVARPTVRRSWLRGARRDPGGPGAESRRPELRGRDPFVEVPWETALSLVADELERVRTEHGNASIFGGSYGWSSAGRFHHAKTQLHRFLGSIGGYTGQIGNYSFGAAAAILPHVVGSAEFASGHTTSWDVIADHTELWVMFGGLPLKNTQLESGGISEHTARGWVRRIAANGTRFVSISPLRDDAPEAARAQWLAPRPGTDTALMLGLAHELLARGLHDDAFLQRYCVGWERFRAYLLGEGDGVSKTAEWAAAITEVDAAEIRDLAVRMAGHRTMVSVTWSLQRAHHGEQPYWAAIALAAMLGQVGLPGGGFGFAYGSTGTTGQTRYPFPAPVLPVGENPVRQSDPTAAIPVARITDMLLNPGGTYEFDGVTRTYPDTRLVYWAGGNPFHHHQDLNRLIRAWQRPETIVVHEPWWTATARHADIVLPATTTLERNDIGAASRDSAIVAMQRAVAPRGEARSDFDIFSALAQRLGAHHAYTEGLDEMAWLRRLYDTTRANARPHGYVFPEFDEFWEAGSLDVARAAPDSAPRGHVLLADFRSDPEAHPLGTPSGRIELFSRTIDAFGYDDCPGHPAWMEPEEWRESGGGADGTAAPPRFPLHLITNQPAHRLHSQLDMASASRDAKVAGREPCRLNPRDAAARGIADGDVVRIHNARGDCLAGAVLSGDVRPGVVQLATGAWYQAGSGSDPDTASDAAMASGGEHTLEVHGNPNVLTRDEGTSRLGQGSAAQTALVEVERYASAQAPPVTVTSEPPVILAE